MGKISFCCLLFCCISVRLTFYFSISARVKRKWWMREFSWMFDWWERRLVRRLLHLCFSWYCYISLKKQQRQRVLWILLCLLLPWQICCCPHQFLSVSLIMALLYAGYKPWPQTTSAWCIYFGQPCSPTHYSKPRKTRYQQMCFQKYISVSGLCFRWWWHCFPWQRTSLETLMMMSEVGASLTIERIPQVLQLMLVHTIPALLLLNCYYIDGIALFICEECFI